MEKIERKIGEGIVDFDSTNSILVFGSSKRLRTVSSKSNSIQNCDRSDNRQTDASDSYLIVFPMLCYKEKATLWVSR